MTLHHKHSLCFFGFRHNIFATKKRSTPRVLRPNLKLFALCALMIFDIKIPFYHSVNGVDYHRNFANRKDI